MSIDSILKKEGINILEKLPTLKTNMIAKNIADKLCATFPEHGFDNQNLFVKLSRLDMYIANLPEGTSMAKYVPQNQSIYFNQDLDINDLSTVAIHECLHFIQMDNAKNQNLKSIGLTGINNTAIAINEASIQLMASEANKEKKDIVTYYNLTIPTVSPTYYTLECALVNQMSYFTGTYPLYHSTINSNDIFKNTFIQKTNKKIYKHIEKNLNKLVELEDILCDLTNELKYLNAGKSKIKSINISIDNKKQEIFNLFLKTQNIIMTNCFNMEFKNIKTMEDLKEFKSKVYNYQYIIASSKDYTFYKDFFYYTMNRIEQKQKYLEEHGYIIMPGDKETALVLFTEKKNLVSFVTTFFSKLRKVSQLNSYSTNKNEE